MISISGIRSDIENGRISKSTLHIIYMYIYLYIWFGLSHPTAASSKQIKINKDDDAPIRKLGSNLGTIPYFAFGAQITPPSLSYFFLTLSSNPAGPIFSH